MALETRHADIIFAQAGARERDYCGRGAHYARHFGGFEELGEIFSEEFVEKIPDFVNSILGAAGQFVAGGGMWSGAGSRRSSGVRRGKAPAAPVGDTTKCAIEFAMPLCRCVTRFAPRCAKRARRRPKPNPRANRHPTRLHTRSRSRPPPTAATSWTF